MDPNFTNFNEALATGIVTHPRLSYCLETRLLRRVHCWVQVEKGFGEAGRSGALVVLSLVALSLGLMAPAAEARIDRRDGRYTTEKSAGWWVE